MSATRTSARSTPPEETSTAMARRTATPDPEPNPDADDLSPDELDAAAEALLAAPVTPVMTPESVEEAEARLATAEERLQAIVARVCDGDPTVKPGERTAANEAVENARDGVKAAEARFAARNAEERAAMKASVEARFSVGGPVVDALEALVSARRTAVDAIATVAQLYTDANATVRSELKHLHTIDPLPGAPARRFSSGMVWAPMTVRADQIAALGRQLDELTSPVERLLADALDTDGAVDREAEKAATLAARNARSRTFSRVMADELAKYRRAQPAPSTLTPKAASAAKEAEAAAEESARKVAEVQADEAADAAYARTMAKFGR